MRVDVKRDLIDSAYDFKRVVWPAIVDVCGGGDFEPVESVTEVKMARDLDMYAGIDVWQVIREKSVIRGIACRIQWGKVGGAFPYNSWTVRLNRHNNMDTEYQKRKYALENKNKGYLYADLTTQGYIEKPRRIGDLLSVGVIKTADLFELIDPTRIRINREDGVEFCWLDFEEAKDAGKKIYVKTFLPQRVAAITQSLIPEAL